MSAMMIEGLAAAVVFAAVYAAYAVGRSRMTLRTTKETRDASNENEHLIHRYRPPIEIVLEYEDEKSRKSRQRTGIVKSSYRDNGYTYLLGRRRNGKKPNSFRVDRIICVATTDGEVIDTNRFLIDRLGIPADLCAASSGRHPATRSAPVN